jgi:hypothetical protein
VAGVGETVKVHRIFVGTTTSASIEDGGGGAILKLIL